MASAEAGWRRRRWSLQWLAVLGLAASGPAGAAQGSGAAPMTLPRLLPDLVSGPAAISLCAPARWRRSTGVLASATAEAAPTRSPARVEAPRWPRLAFATAAAAVGGGALASWSKARADRAYERYLHAAGQRRQERGYARAERYDRIAGVGLATMEAGLAATTYLVFF